MKVPINKEEYTSMYQYKMEVHESYDDQYKLKTTLWNWSGAVFSQSSLCGNSGTSEAEPLKQEDW